MGNKHLQGECQPCWGYASSEMYAERWKLIAEQITEKEFVLVDWGSDAGWFSIRIAGDFPESTVISVEAGIMTDGQGISTHRDKQQEYGIRNNVLVNRLFGPDTFTGLSAVPSDYQLVLSVFHHIGDGFGRYLRRVDEWDEAFCSLIRGSKVTFFEIPNEGNSDETPHRIRDWYGDRDVEKVINAALESGNVQADVLHLGETRHGSKGPRKLFKITLNEPVETVSAAKITAFIEASGRLTRVRPYRRLRFALARLYRKVRKHG